MKCRLSHLLVAMLTASILFGVAAMPSRAAKWRVSGTITGNYGNNVGWTCLETGAVASISERLTYDVKLRPRYTASYTGAGIFGAKMTATAGGTWTMGGSYPPARLTPLGGTTCAAPVAFSCSGSVVRSAGGQAHLSLTKAGRFMVGKMVQFAGFAESALLQRPADPICDPNSSEETSRVLPLFGLIGTEIENDAALAPVRIAASRLRGRKKFTLTLPTSKPSGCISKLSYTTCSESGGFTMKLKFKPVR